MRKRKARKESQAMERWKKRREQADEKQGCVTLDS